MDTFRVAALAVLAALGCPARGQGPEVPPPAKAALNPRLLAIADNAWLNLQPEGMAKARMYSGACFGGGLLWYFGGAHRSYPGNDVQLYDPPANRWIQATEAEMPPRGTPQWKALVSGGGASRKLSPKGRPYTEHTYQQVCWQPKRRRFFVVLVSSGTWEFDPATRKWVHLIDRFKNRQGDPRGSWAQNHVLYEPAFEAPVLVVGSGGGAAMYRFDHEGRLWQRLGSTPALLRWNEFYSTYVPQWKAHLISTTKKGFYRLDVPSRKLTPIESPEALRGCQALSCDTASGVVVALASRKVSKYRRTVVPWVLDLRTLKWRQMSPSGPAPVGQTTGRWAVFWYDPAHNVHLLINCVRRDRRELFDGGVTETWAYRYQRPSPTTR